MTCHGCDATFHVECLAANWRASSSAGSGAAASEGLGVPEPRGRCPCCSQPLSWMGLLSSMRSIKSCRRRCVWEGDSPSPPPPTPACPLQYAARAAPSEVGQTWGKLLCNLHMYSTHVQVQVQVQVPTPMQPSSERMHADTCLSCRPVMSACMQAHALRAGL